MFILKKINNSSLHINYKRFKNSIVKNSYFFFNNNKFINYSSYNNIIKPKHDFLI